MSEEQFAGMTLNERLFASGLLESFDDALASRDRAALTHILATVNTSPGLVSMLLGEGYECWFCGNGIVPHEPEALHIGLSNLWGDNEGEPTQTIYAHFACAHERMLGAKMKIERETFASETGEA